MSRYLPRALRLIRLLSWQHQRDMSPALCSLNVRMGPSLLLSLSTLVAFTMSFLFFQCPRKGTSCFVERRGIQVEIRACCYDCKEEHDADSATFLVHFRVFSYSSKSFYWS